MEKKLNTNFIAEVIEARTLSGGEHLVLSLELIFQDWMGASLALQIAHSVEVWRYTNFRPQGNGFTPFRPEEYLFSASPKSDR